MWTYLAYIIYKLFEKKNEVTVSDVCGFVMNKDCELHIYFTFEELLSDLEYLKELGIIDIRGNKIIPNFEKLKEIVNTVEESWSITGIYMFEIYRRKIVKCLNQYFK